MNCEKYSNLIEDFAENELDQAIADEVSLHVFACPSCERTLENLTREKEVYSQLFFEVEPPKNISQRFHARLENEIESQTVLSATKISLGERIANLFSWSNPLPAMTALCALLLFGLGLSLLQDSANEKAESKTSIIEKANQISPSNALPKQEFEPQKFTPEVATIADKSAKNSAKVSLRKIRAVERANEKSEAVKIASKDSSVRKNSDSAKAPILSEEEKLRFEELQAFEQRTVKQMEKIEMLLRSFRNARFSEETARYDVSFETEQARKLLETNENLRARAETYGDFYTKEILEKIEPYLLDIANLENAPATETILDIKQRVKNQNLIASLQGF